jgi:hypothetical protein
MWTKLIVGAAIVALWGGGLKAHHGYTEYLPLGQTITIAKGRLKA